MKCPFCDFESALISEQDAMIELDKHIAIEHPEQIIPPNIVLAILEFHHKYNVPFEELIEDFFRIRFLMSQKFGDEARREINV